MAGIKCQTLSLPPLPPLPASPPSPPPASSARLDAAAAFDPGMLGSRCRAVAAQVEIDSKR